MLQNEKKETAGTIKDVCGKIITQQDVINQLRDEWGLAKAGQKVWEMYLATLESEEVQDLPVREKQNMADLARSLDRFFTNLDSLNS